MKKLESLAQEKLLRKKEIITMKTLNNYKNINLPSINEEQLKEIEALKLINDSDINTVDIPELTTEQMKTGHFAYANPLNKCSSSAR